MLQPVLGDIALFVAFAMATFAVLFGTRHIDATEHQDGLMLAIATEVDRQARRLPGGRHLRDVRACSTVRRSCSRAGSRARRYAAVLARDAARRHAVVTMTLLSLVRHPAAAAAVPRHGGGEQQRGGDPAGRLAVPALPRADQPVRRADRDRRPAELSRPARSTATCSCWRCRCAAGSDLLTIAAFIGGLSAATAHGDRRDRSRSPSWSRTTSSCRSCSRRPQGCVSGLADIGAAARSCGRGRDLRHPLPRLHLLPVGRRRAACLDRPPVALPRSRSSRRPSSAA